IRNFLLCWSLASHSCQHLFTACDIVFGLNQKSVKCCTNLIFRKNNRFLHQNDSVFLFFQDFDSFSIITWSNYYFTEQFIYFFCCCLIKFSIRNQNTSESRSWVTCQSI